MPNLIASQCQRSWETLENMFRQAQRAIEEEHYDEAFPLLEQLVKERPREPLFYWSLGYALLDAERFAEAATRFKQAIKLDARNVPAWGGLGRVYMELGPRYWSKAESAFRKRLRLKKSVQHYVFLAYVLLRKGESAKAARYLRRAIAMEPAFDEAYFYLAVALRRQGKSVQAARALERAAALDPEYRAYFAEFGLKTHPASKHNSASANNSRVQKSTKRIVRDK